MSNATATPDAPQLTGYELISHLGSGGYGDVWSARVPGGLTKAVKIIHGRHDESRAALELKSLERIREVRHPFVVSLERVEFVDDRLVVVTEQAEGSLRDRFRECVESGQTGIPRDELMRYLRDAADALDYLVNKHGLQHLDIKPENILLMAGHAKVADFGLVKAINDNTQSIVGGMTPAYAAPEVFKGEPTRASDQYSLAVLYQQLLTGVLPFDGENAAELTLQHMNDDPNVSALSTEDRFVICRALSKSPEHRYESCSDFVRALEGSHTSYGRQPAGPAEPAVSANPRPAASAEQPAATYATECYDAGEPTKTEARLGVDLPPLPADGPEPKPLQDQDGQSFTLTPTLYIGVGGSAGAILRELRQRHNEHFESSGPAPGLPMLLLDTDSRTLSAVGRNAGSGVGLKRDETLCLALRRPQEYREKADKILGWLGRRWLYNVPKSLQTEGLRPLGRLALVDHARRTMQRIRHAVSECVSEENLAAAEEATGREFARDAIRVYVVASASGGAGGGMALDIAYAARAMISRLEIENARVIGITTCSTSRDPEQAGLARVNTFSWLSEHQYFSNPANAYPGDPEAGLPPHPAEVGPFDSSYLAHLGDRLDDDAYARGCESVADYLFADSCTPLQCSLDAVRDQAGNDTGPAPLRTFAVTRHESAPAAARHDAEQVLVNLLLSNWLGESSGSSEDVSTTNRVVIGAGELVGRLKLDAAHLATDCRAIVEQHVTSAANLAPTGGDLIDRLTQINAAYEPLPELNTPLLGEASPNHIGQTPITDLVRPSSDSLQSEVAKWVLARLEAPGDRVCSAQQAAEWLHSHCESPTSQFQRFAAATQQKLSEVAGQARAPDADAAAVEARYSHLKADLAALEAAALVAAGLKTEIREIMQQLHEVRTAAGAIAKQLTGDLEGPASEAHKLMADSGVTPTKLVQEIDSRLHDEWSTAGAAFGAHMLHDEGRAQAAAAIRRIAHQVLRETVHTSCAGRAQVVDFPTQLPHLGEFAGACYRALVAGPSVSLDESASPQAARVCHSGNDAYLVTECDGLSPAHTAVFLAAGRRDYAEFAERVHTRRDVSWGDILASADELPAACTTANQTFPTLVCETSGIASEPIPASEPVAKT